MRRGPIAAILAVATILGIQTPIWAQSTFNPGQLVPSSAVPTPNAARLVRYRRNCLRRGVADGRHPCARPRIDSHRSRPHDPVLFPRAGGMAAGSGPVPGSDRTTPPPTPPESPPLRSPQQTRGRHIDIPPHGVTAFVPNEILVEVESDTPGQYLNVVARRLQLTLLETQSFTLTGRTLQRWRIDGSNSVRATFRALAL